MRVLDEETQERLDLLKLLVEEKPSGWLLRSIKDIRQNSCECCSFADAIDILYCREFTTRKRR